MSGGGGEWSNSGYTLQRDPRDLLMGQMEGLQERVESSPGWCGSVD